MTGMTISEFLDKVYHGGELEFVVGEITYFVQSWQKDGTYYLSVDDWTRTDGTEPQHDYRLWLACKSPAERLKSFEKAKVFDGKDIYEVEAMVRVEFG